MRIDEVIKIFEYRFACKEFDKKRKISEENLHCILEAGILSPSSFGLEPWKFLVVRNLELKSKLMEASFNQKQMITCSDVVVILAKKGFYEAGNPHVAEMFKRWNYPDNVFNSLIDFYSELERDVDQVQLALEQCHIAAANMMTAAAMLGVDSCAIGGYDDGKIREILNVDQKKFEIALMIPFGYREGAQPAKVRLPFEEIVEFR